MKQISAYLAGGLFNVGQRFHNSLLEKNLITSASEKNIELITTSPQRKAFKRYIKEENRFDVAEIVSDCEKDASEHDYIICNLDGTDCDSGTAIEIGIARGVQLSKKLSTSKLAPKIITYRTDFRTAPEKEIGINAMLRPDGSTFIYYPCFAIELNEFNEFYQKLASQIVHVIEKDTPF